MIRLGVIGYGSRIHGVIHHAVRAINEDVRVVGVVDPDETGARERLAECDKDATFYPDLDTMIREGKLDGLAIGTRCNLHTPMAIEAAKYDLPLFLEKPVAVSFEQAHALEAGFENSKCEVVVSFPLRVSPLCDLVRRTIVEGATGEVQHVTATNFVSYGAVYWEEGYRNFDVTQGLFLQKATHDLDYLMYLVGAPITQVSAMANYGQVFGGNKPAGLRCSTCDETAGCRESPDNRGRAGSFHPKDHLCVFSQDCGSPESGTNEDCSSALMRFANGAHGSYSQVFFTKRDAARRGATLAGYNGTVSFDWYDNQMTRVRHHEPFSDVVKAGEGRGHFGGDWELASDFVALIEGKIKRSRTPIETGIQSAYTCLAAKQSAETGQFVDVPQVGAAGTIRVGV